MSDNADQLAVLGQQVLDTISRTYNPSKDPGVALALHPGQALADDIVQEGQTNPLRLSEWVEDQYDYPLLLTLADATSIAASSIGDIRAKSAYLAMIPWAQPVGSPNTPGYARVEALIADARKDIGSRPDALPFECEPTDFAEPDSTVWHVFDQQITSSTTNTVGQPPVDPATPIGAPLDLVVNPKLWQMRAVTPALLERVMASAAIVEKRRSFSANIATLPRALAVETLRSRHSLSDAIAMPMERTAFSASSLPLTRSASIASAALTFQKRAVFSDCASADLVSVAPRIEPAEEGVTPRHLDVSLIDGLAAIQTNDLVAAPVVASVTTAQSSLHVHFEYCLLTIARRLGDTPWWHAELLADDGWFVAGMRRGEMVPASDNPGIARCLPKALLLVRNVAFTGSWSVEAHHAMQSSLSFLGPFLVRATGSVINEQVSVLGQGIQVIGELCSILPPLPPNDDPALSTPG